MGTTASISYYGRINHIDSKETTPVDLFFDDIREGKWEDLCHIVRQIEDKKLRDKTKADLLPSVTISGKFTSRADSKIERHSGLIGMDIDENDFPEGMNAEEFKSVICCDKHVVAAFISASGRGLCVIFSINSGKHREAFQGLCSYIYENYNAVCDPTSINPSRARFVSYDPQIYVNSDQVPKFVIYPKEKPPKKIEKVIYVKSDFDELVQQIISRHLNLCESYYDWIRICFSLVHQFGEAGRQYFHLISQFSTKYDSSTTDKQFTNCIRHTGTNVITIATLYYYCKQAGLILYSERTRKIAYTTTTGKLSGLKAPQIAENLKKHENIEGEDVIPLIQKIIDDGIELNDDTLLDQLEMFIRQNYNLRRNVITKYIENNGKAIEQEEMNSLFIRCKKIFDKVNYELLDRLIHSDFIPDYNPFIEFFERNIEMADWVKEGKTPNIDKILSSIRNEAPEYCQYFGKKWLVGIASAMMGIHSPLVFVLVGKQRTGKTEWFRRLFPEELRGYYAESKLDAGKDDHILMTQKALVMDDEMSGKSKKEARYFKDLTSKAYFDLREPYGKHNVTLKRFSVLGGTANEKEILVDSTGNTRIIPVVVNQKIDFTLYNSVNKVELFMEMYHLWKSGFDWQIVSEIDQELLKKDEGMFEVKSSEGELIMKYYEVPDGISFELVTATDIMVHLYSKTMQKLSLTVIGRELAKMGFEQVHKRVGNTTGRFYKVCSVTGSKPQQEDDSPPF